MHLKVSFVRFPVVLLIVILCACTSKKAESSETSDSTITDAADSTAPSTSIEEEDDAEHINDEDHGAPGLEDTKRSFGDLEPYVQQFIQSLQGKQIQNLIDSTGLLVVTPGPGLYPLSNIASTADEVIAIKEVTSLLDNPSFANNTLQFYTWHYDICDAESLPDGVYLDGPYVEEIGKDLWTSDETAQLDALNSSIKNLQYRYGKDFNIRFTNTTGETTYLTLHTYLKNDKLFLFMIDQRDCGA
jgi:hypothetical protein